MNIKDEEYISNLKKYIEKTEESVKHSLGKFDVLIISLSSGSLILTISLFKTYFSREFNKELLVTSLILFSVALIANLLSLVIGFITNKYDIKVTKIIIKEIEQKETIDKKEKLQGRQNDFNFLAKLLKAISLIGLIAGIIALITFIISTIETY
ncbi:hypothetical protein [Kordia jejudonensis]|uniref:hypothetical protein n=1 Tax=Kordia jejudonensis TaxID=1348245 RepID=UPI0012E06E3A|nr:hypothetical protein [Kordia jejudonensis]